MSEEVAGTAPRELVAIIRTGVNIGSATQLSSEKPTAEADSLGALLGEYGAEIAPLFDEEPGGLALPSTAIQDEVLGSFYFVLSDDEKLDELAERLTKFEFVESVYIKPGAEPAALNQMTPTTAAPRLRTTPNFAHLQGYLNPAPDGIGASSGWALTGGRGRGVEVVDIEGAWRFSHEDLLSNGTGVIGGTSSVDIRWRNHGTAVLGEISGDHNGRGVYGISPDAKFSAVSIFPRTMGSARAIQVATRRLRAGDSMLIELHRPGPAANGTGQHGYIAIEWWPDDFVVLRAASQRGIIVVEAAGNGGQDLDDAIYDSGDSGFPGWWRSPFRRRGLDSGAVLVGAGAPPPGTNQRNHGPDRSRLDFSNFGDCVDAQGWGREVTTCGYGDLQGGSNEDRWYTSRFSGTSSASPIVVGAVTSLQGIVKHHGGLLTPSQVRDLLRNTGSPQQHALGRPVTQRIGNRPDLSAMIQSVLSL